MGSHAAKNQLRVLELQELRDEKGLAPEHSILGLSKAGGAAGSNFLTVQELKCCRSYGSWAVVILER